MTLHRPAWKWIWAMATLAWLHSAAAEPARADRFSVVHQAPSEFNGQVFVVDEDGQRFMRFGSPSGDNQSRIEVGHPERLPMRYLRSAAVGLAVPERVERVLMIGLGGGAFARFTQQVLPHAHIDAVEIDPTVVALAARYFGVEESESLRVHVMDGAAFVAQDNAPYDYILLDAYDADSIPAALVTSTFFEKVKANLAAGGVVASNVWLSDDTAHRELLTKLTGHFEYCLRLTLPYSANEVLLLSLQPLPSPGHLGRAVRPLDRDPVNWPDLGSIAREAQSCPEAPSGAPGQAGQRRPAVPPLLCVVNPARCPSTGFQTSQGAATPGAM